MVERRQIGDVDAAYEKLKPLGKYTLIQYSFQTIVRLIVTYHVFSVVFTGQKNPFRCPTAEFKGYNETNSTQTARSLVGNGSIFGLQNLPYDGSCQQTELTNGSYEQHISPTQCTSHNVEYELPKDKYFTSEFDLVCDRVHLIGLTQTLLILGQMIGSFLFPYFSDHYGRKPVVLITSILWFGSALGLCFSVNYTMFAVFKTLVGVFLQGCAQAACTLMSEMLVARHRGLMFACLGSLLWTFGAIIIAPVAYLLRDHSWRTLEFLSLIYYGNIILLILFSDESVRWLAANGLGERMMRILKKASRWNGRKFEDVVAAFYNREKQDVEMLSTDNNKETDKTEVALNGNTEEKAHELDKESGAANVEHLNLWHLFTIPLLRVNTLFCLLAWFFNSLIYYALILMSSTLSGSLYLNYSLNCLVEVPQAIFCYFYVDKLGRKKCFALFCTIAGISLTGAAITLAISPEQDIVVSVLSIIGKLGISGSFNVLYAMTPELFPTNVRNMSFGLSVVAARVGGMLAPFAELLMKKAVYAPGLVFGVGSLLLSVTVYFIPETANRQLPQSVADMEKWVDSPKRKRNLSS